MVSAGAHEGADLLGGNTGAGLADSGTKQRSTPVGGTSQVRVQGVQVAGEPEPPTGGGRCQFGGLASPGGQPRRGFFWVVIVAAPGPSR